MRLGGRPQEVVGISFYGPAYLPHAMSTLQVKKVPEDLKARLVRQARARGLSLSEFVLEALERALDEAEWRERLAQRAPVDLGLPAAKLLEEAREERWPPSS
jgi:plasmid stability protein